MRTRKKQEGSVAVMAALFLLMILSFAAIAIDVGNLMVSRGETQNAADAAALAGASCLYRRAECNNLTLTEPTFDTAASEAAAFTSSNSVQNVALKDADIQTGYWNLTRTPYGLEDPTNFAPTPNDAPAIRVTIHKDGSDGPTGNGKIATYLASIMGFNSMSTSATATAVLASPGAVGKNTLFPMAIESCLYSQFWDFTNNMPKIVQPPPPPVVSPQPSPYGATQVVGEPYRFMVYSSYHPVTGSGCDIGQWTTFDQGANADEVKTLIGTGNPTPESVNSNINIENGTVDAIFKNIMACLTANTCDYVTVPVVDSFASSPQPIRAFACLHIIAAKNGNGDGNGPYVEVQMSNNPGMCQPAGANGTGPYYGANAPPRLVQ
jgi:Flp pilus assembly protein TadG